MKTILRYTVPLGPVADVPMPAGAAVISAAPSRRRDDGLEVWAVVDPDAAAETRRFHVFAPGAEIHPDQDGTFVATVDTHEGGYTWHLYDGGPVR